jgi:hypothetical protein
MKIVLFFKLNCLNSPKNYSLPFLSVFMAWDISLKSLLKCPLTGVGRGPLLAGIAVG